MIVIQTFRLCQWIERFVLIESDNLSPNFSAKIVLTNNTLSC